VVDTPIKLREPGSVLRFAEHMIRDYSKNALAVRNKGRRMFIGISKEKRLRKDFGVTFIEIFIKPSIPNWLPRTWCSL
jgi:hypothetical protein